MQTSFKIAMALALALCAGASHAHPGPEPHDYKVAWLKRPTDRQMELVRPNAAYAAGIREGGATLECEVALNGWLKRCEVIEERPAKMDYGGAALALAPFFKFSVENRGDEPVVVRIPINWKGAGATRETAVISRAIWTAAPTTAEVEAAYPAGLSGDARIIFDCTITTTGGLSGCKPLAKDPDNRRFVDAARQLLPLFRAPLQAQGGASLAGAHVMLPVQLLDPAIRDREPPITQQPVWRALPGPGEIVYPAAARSAGIESGKATVDCMVGAQGVLEDCRAVTEVPTGAGFGEAALKAADFFAVNPWTYEGRPVDGQRLRIPVGFVDDQAQDLPASPSGQ